jgi:septum formation inhibitor-activating ATPase MinD
LAKKADYVFVVTLHSAASIRSAEKLALFLSEQGSRGENVRLIINCFNPKGVARGLNLGIVEIIERSKIKLIGLISINNQIRDYQEVGKTVYDLKGVKLRKSFDDMIGRILENNVVLSKKIDGVKTNNLYFKKETKNEK